MRVETSFGHQLMNLIDYASHRRKPCDRRPAFRPAPKHGLTGALTRLTCVFADPPTHFTLFYISDACTTGWEPRSQKAITGSISVA